ncbi:MAG: hypothetical protein ACI8U0_001320 [Flavobacteriales bacterium]|jgi:hypothetical protein
MVLFARFYRSFFLALNMWSMSPPKYEQKRTKATLAIKQAIKPY